MPKRSMISVPESFEMDADQTEEFSQFHRGHPHQVEAEVSKALRDYPGISVESLSIHQVDGGVCLHGVIEVDDPSLDVASLVRRAVGIDQVINRMIVRPGRSPHHECTLTELGFTGEWA